MFKIAILVGIYSYIIFALGLLGILYPNVILVITFVFLMAITIPKREEILKTIKAVKIKNFIFKEKLPTVLFFLFLLQALINLIGALGPELAFDALWYHLTLPKLYLINHAVIHIPGGLLYYSGMPKLTEMFYTVALAFNNELLAKVIHFTFGVLSCLAIYKLSRKFFDQKLSLITTVIFYSNLVVAWQSTTSYVDLARTFFEIMALWGFINWWEKKKLKWLIESAVMMGLAISVKLLAFGSLFIFLVLILLSAKTYKKPLKNLPLYLFTYFSICLLIPLPWFAFSFVNTGNPIYPIFTDVYRVNFDINLLNPLQFIADIWNLFTHSADPISPLYVIFLPLVIIFFNKFNSKIKLVVFYSLLALIVWYITPRTGGGRFILSYLPAFSIVAGAVIQMVNKIEKIRTMLVGLVILVSLVSIIYRGVANAKYLPVILGYETKSQFLTNHLNFSFGDFYDTDNYFKNHIAQNDRVLLYGFQNLYYIDFPFIDSSWVKKGDAFNYIAVQNTELPKRFWYWDLVYQNKKTHVKLYSLGGQKWVY